MTSIYITLQDVHGDTFAERIGGPDECTSALGYVIVGFSWLERTLEEKIAEMAHLSATAAPAITFGDVFQGQSRSSLQSGTDPTSAA